MPATRRLILIIVILFLVLLFLVVPGVSWSQTPQNPWAEPARELAKKIASITGPRQTVALTVRNISSLSDAEVAAVREALEAALRNASLGVARKSNTAPELRITLSENFQGLLWVAEISGENAPEITMQSVQNTRQASSLPADYQIMISKQFVIESERPILDFFLTSPFFFGKGELLTLDTYALSHYRANEQAWVLEQWTELPSTIRWPRDPRAKLERDGPSISIYLPGMKCAGITLHSPQLKCAAGPDLDAVWNLSGAAEDLVSARINPRRNFFEGKLPLTPKADVQVSPFYSVVDFEGASHYWILAGIDSRLHVFSERNYSTDLKPVQELAGLGSELAPIRSSCGQHLQFLTTRQSDWTELDSIQAFEIVEGKVVAVSAALEFPGPITALWPGDVDDFAHAVVRNLKTGRYEAYTLTLTCGR